MMNELTTIAIVAVVVIFCSVVILDKIVKLYLLRQRENRTWMEANQQIRRANEARRNTSTSKSLKSPRVPNYACIVCSESNLRGGSVIQSNAGLIFLCKEHDKVFCLGCAHLHKEDQYCHTCDTLSIEDPRYMGISCNLPVKEDFES